MPRKSEVRSFSVHHAMNICVHYLPMLVMVAFVDIVVALVVVWVLLTSPILAEKETLQIHHPSKQDVSTAKWLYNYNSSGNVFS